MAGLGARLFPAFSKLTSAQVNGYLMDQTIMRFASTAARDAAFGGAGEPTLAEGMTCYLDDTNVLQSYTGSAWVTLVSSTTPPSSVLLATGSATNQSFFEITGFSSAYSVHEVILFSEGATTPLVTNNFSVRFYNGTTPRASNYYGSGFYSGYNGTSGTTGVRNNASDAIMTGASAGSTNPSTYRFTVRGMMTSARPNIMGQYYDNYSLLNVNFGYLCDFTGTNDRIRFTPDAQNVTYSWSLFGIRTSV